MQSALNFKSFIGGVRVSSASRARSPESQQHRFNSKASEATRDLAEHIPYWPQTIRVPDLMMVTGLSKTSIVSRISSCHGEYLIFNDRGRLSRLRQDLSNCN